MQLLIRFLFSYEQVRQPIGEMSGGERTRLELLLLMRAAPTAWCWTSRPTTWTSTAVEVLEGAIERFDGTVIVVSHDRYFLDRICDRVVEVAGGRAIAYEGGYSTWYERHRAERAVHERARRRPPRAAEERRLVARERARERTRRQRRLGVLAAIGVVVLVVGLVVSRWATAAATRRRRAGEQALVERSQAATAGAARRRHGGAAPLPAVVACYGAPQDPAAGRAGHRHAGGAARS